MECVSSSLEGPKVATDAKGESIAFVFEGGGVVIYWDGKTF
jgi:hypothetical protein